MVRNIIVQVDLVTKMPWAIICFENYQDTKNFYDLCFKNLLDETL